MMHLNFCLDRLFSCYKIKLTQPLPMFLQYLIVKKHNQFLYHVFVTINKFIQKIKVTLLQYLSVWHQSRNPFQSYQQEYLEPAPLPL